MYNSGSVLSDNLHVWLSFNKLARNLSPLLDENFPQFTFSTLVLLLSTSAHQHYSQIRFHIHIDPNSTRICLFCNRLFQFSSYWSS